MLQFRANLTHFELKLDIPGEREGETDSLSEGEGQLERVDIV